MTTRSQFCNFLGKRDTLVRIPQSLGEEQDCYEVSNSSLQTNSARTEEKTEIITEI